MSDTNELDDMLTTIFDEQLKLQVRLGYDPLKMSTEDVIEYLIWNSVALSGELSEAMGEIGWKKWATSKHINRTAFVCELIDVTKFLLNMALAVGVTPAEFLQVFLAKTVVNHERANNGYDGVSGKCAGCGRANDEPHHAA